MGGSWKSVTRQNKCPICQKPDWCSITADGKVVACRRVNTGEGKEKVDKAGSSYWVYFLGKEGPGGPGLEKYSMPDDLPADPGPAEKAEPETLNKAYSLLLDLDGLSLTDDHKKNLLKRGLSDKEITRRGYGSLPKRGRARIAKKMLEKLGPDTLAKIPGFYMKEGEGGRPYWTLGGMAGLVVPVRDEAGQAVVLKIRPDEEGQGKYLPLTSSKRKGAVQDGPGPGALIHFPLPPENSENRDNDGIIRVTEGELKADVATYLSGILTVSIPGVSTWRQVLPALKKMGAKKVLLAFDGDARENVNVARAQKMTAQALEKEGFKVRVETWPAEYKGIDDALAAGVEVKILDAEDAWRKIHMDEYEAKKMDAERAIEKLKVDPLGREALNSAYEAIAQLQIVDAVNGDIYENKMKEILKSYGIKAKTVEGGTKLRRKKINGKGGNGAAEESPSCPYFEQRNMMHMTRMTNEGPVPVPLANFTAKIQEERIRDDGAEAKVDFIISGTLGSGEPLPLAEVPASKFPQMNWATEHWGTRAVVYAGQGTKDHMRCAIQLTSDQVDVKHYYQHTGWRKIKDKWVFLHAGGGIGEDGQVDGVHVDHSGSLQNVILPHPPAGLDREKAVKEALKLLDVAPGRITYPLLGAVSRAPLAELFPVDHSIFISGPTGTQKTELAVLAQAFVGPDFTASNLPAGWSSTANSNERMAFLAKDIPLVIDDFCPQGTSYDVSRLHREADRLLRGAGNQAGRGRMNADGSLRPTYKPRGFIISTGEDTPRGQSLLARIFTLEVEPGDVNLVKLTELQKAARDGWLAKCMSAYVQYLARRMDELQVDLPELLIEYREKARERGLHLGTHDRTPDVFASTLLGFHIFLSFTIDEGILDESLGWEYLQRAEKSIFEAAEKQGEILSGEDPVKRFLQLLVAAVASGQAHLADAVYGGKPDNAENWGWRDGEPMGNLVGWISAGGEFIYLQPDATFSVAQKFASSQGAALAIGQKTLWKRMSERKYLAEMDQGKNTCKKTICGERKRVISIPSPLLSEWGQWGHKAEEAHSTEGNKRPHFQNV